MDNIKIDRSILNGKAIVSFLENDDVIGELTFDVNSENGVYNFTGRKEAFNKMVEELNGSPIQALVTLRNECLKRDLCIDCEIKYFCDNNGCEVPGKWKI